MKRENDSAPTKSFTFLALMPAESSSLHGSKLSVAYTAVDMELKVRRLKKTRINVEDKRKMRASCDFLRS